MNQKLEDLLQLALLTPERIREQTEELNVGFSEADKTWELIVKYHGSLEELATQRIQVEELIAGYAILTVPENLVEAVAELEQIEYVEKPKRFFYEAIDPTEDSCVQELPRGDLFLSGQGVLIAVIDSGIDYRLADFRKEDQSTRIRYLWDQTLRADPGVPNQRPPEGFLVGVEFNEEQINAALLVPTPAEQLTRIPSLDISGHGTAVAGIAAGFHQGQIQSETIYDTGMLPNRVSYRGVAPDAELLIVKLGLPEVGSFPRTTQIMRAVTWAVRKGLELQMPLVINLSFGNSYGSHDGSSLLERFLDNAAEIGRTVICVGSGNEGASNGHASGRLEERRQTEVELSVGDYERSLSIQLWKNYSDVYRILLRSPGGRESDLPLTIEGGKYTLTLEKTEILVYIGEPTPYSSAQEIYLELIPLSGSYINSGVWTIRLEAVRAITGQFYLYLPAQAARNATTGFFRADPEVTLTIPSTASKVITVGAYDSTYDAYADFSGRGYADSDRTIGVVIAGMAKPDLAAPGVGILAPDRFGGYLPVTGTSFATPIVSGSAALLMEWGIVRGNDPFLYGEKVKAYLRKGAKPLRGESIYPNAKVGWGTLCVRESLPK